MSSKKRIFVVEFPQTFDQHNMNQWLSSDTYKDLLEDYHVITMTGDKDNFNCYLVPENIKENE